VRGQRVRVGNRRAGERIAEPGELIVDDTPGQVASRVVEADRVLVVGALVEDVEGARAAAAHDSGVVRAVGLGAGALTDEPVADRAAFHLGRTWPSYPGSCVTWIWNDTPGGGVNPSSSVVL
jgi:hypothetical protein